MDIATSNTFFGVFEGLFFKRAADIRRVVEENPFALLEKVRKGDRKNQIHDAIVVVSRILKFLDGLGINSKAGDPGHAVGHMLRDFANACRLLKALDLPQGCTFIGLVSGVLHDLGCVLVDRYTESTRAIRHAEMAGLAVDAVLAVNECGISEEEKYLIVYGIMAHTHYLTSSEIVCADGAVRQIRPYLEVLEDGSPFWPVWLPRWIDRLDTNGPAYPGRHFLTLINSHQDFDGEVFYDQDFQGQMLPLEKAEAGHMTMLSHLRMYANSQTNDSIYGRFDSGRMCELRDAYRAQLLTVLDAVKTGFAEGMPDEKIIIEAWSNFLVNTVEPSTASSMVVKKLRQSFTELPPEIRKGWTAGFFQAMKEYIVWYDGLKADLGDDFSVALPGVADDPLALLKPHQSWTALVG